MRTQTQEPGRAAAAPRAVSVAQMFYDRVAATPDAEAYRFPTHEGWASVTWAETGKTVRTLAAGLLALGIQHEERVAIASNTRIEWLYADLAVSCAGAATTTVYPTTGPEDVGFILADSGSRIIFAEDDAQIEKVRGQRDRLPDLVRVITFDGTPDGDWVLGLDDLRALGEAHLAEHPTAVDDAVAAVRPEDLATLIYTSGTTGRPKGVELPHRCWTYIGAGAEDLGIMSLEDLQYLWLPLSHSFGKMLSAVQLQIGFPTAVDGRIDKIVENLAQVHPTFMAGPPASSRRSTRRSCRPWPRRAVSRAPCSAGRSAWDGRSAGRSSRAGARARSSGPSTRSPTGWSSPGSATGSAAGSAT